MMGFKNVVLADMKTKNHKQEIITDLNKYHQVVGKIKYACELVGAENQQVKPYFEVDKEVVEDDVDYDYDVDILEKKIIIKDLFDLDSVEDIYTTIRDPREKGDKIKYSYHLCVDKIRISNFNIKSMLQDKNIDCFDLGVYDKNRAMSCIGNVGKPNTNEVLPVFKPYENNTDISKFCISYIEEDYIDYDLKFPKREVEKPDPIKDILKCNICEDYELIKELVNCLSVKRADDYANWLNVGFCLYNISSELLELWEEFSQKSNKYEDGKCQELWDKMTKKNMTIGTLKYWAKIDDPKKYNKIIVDSVSSIIDTSLGSDGSHYDVAVVVGRFMKDMMVYDSIVKSWYIVNDKTNIWQQDKEGNKIPEILAVYICKLYLKRCNTYSSIETDDPIVKAINDDKSKKCLKIATQLKNSSYQDSIKKMLKSVFLRDDFFEKYLNKKINLFAFNNCVYDTEIKAFRDIEPTDYISVTTGYDFNYNDVDMEYVQKVENLLRQIMPCNEKYEYLLDVSSLRLYGKNLLQEFYIFTGGGANGKSLWFNLMKYALGNYFDKLNSETFTKESRGANQTSEISGVVNCRAVGIEEPDDNDKLIVNRLKELSGDAPYKTRGLYQESFSFVPQFALLFLCNQIPALSKMEFAIARRLRVLKFDVKFTDNPVLENERLIDRTLNKDITDNQTKYGSAFMYLLLKNWERKDLIKKLHTPQDVFDKSNEYMDDSNDVKSFLDEYYEKTADDKAKISSSILYAHFKCVYRENKMRKDVFKNAVIDEGFRWKRENKGSFHYNIKAKEIEDSDDDS